MIHVSSGRGGPSRRDFMRVTVAGGAAATLLPGLSSCQMLSGSGSGGGAGGDVRFAFAPDAIWDYMLREGVIQRYEEEHGLVIETSSTWDEFAYFAGGHGDIVSTATYELPLLEDETGIETVTFGQYNLLRITPVVRADSDYQTLADIPEGSKIAVPSAVSSTLVWGMFAKELHDLDFRVGGGDFDLVVEDHFVMPEHLARGEVEAALVIPEAVIGLLRKEEARVMYDNKLPHQVYGDVCGCEHLGVMGNLFTATAEWFEDHQDQAAAFLALWNEGIQLWRENQAEIIQDFPQHFSVEDEEDIEAMQEYLADHDWFVETVALDDEWIEREQGLYDVMKSTGFMEEDAPIPRFEAIEPSVG